ncbi:MAG: long-chain fatty acid--CoA ligase [Haliangiales bacterium]
MDVSPYLNIAPAPQAVFDRLDNHPEVRDTPRFQRATAAGWIQTTWGQFGDQIRDIAMYLASTGLNAGDRVAIYAHNQVAWAAASLGIQAAGGVMVPVYPASTAEQLAYVLRHSDARVLFTATATLIERSLAIAGTCPALTRVVVLPDEPEGAASAAAPGAAEAEASAPTGQILINWARAREIGHAAHERAPGEFRATLSGLDLDMPGLMLYTSGTSGAPKGVPLTHRNVGANACDWLRCNGPLLSEEMVDLLWLPMSHIFGFGEMCLGNTLGFTSYMVEPSEVLSRLPEVKPSVLMSVPAYWEKIAQTAWPPGSADSPAERAQALHEVTGGRLRFCLSGGAGLERSIKERFHDCGLLIVEGYGLTETSPTLTLNRPDSFRFDSVGKPLPSVSLRLEEDGEILAFGPNVFSGYHKDPEASAACFTDDGWFRTGDLGRFTDDGFLQIIGRKKEILVTAGGKNVPPANIELHFRDDPLIEHLVVYGDGKKYLVAGVWLNLAGDADRGPAGDEQRRRQVEERIERVNQSLARHETIKRFCIMETPLTVENGLLTASLKLRRNRVYEAFREQFEALY